MSAQPNTRPLPGALPTFGSRAEALKCAREMQTRIRARAARTEADRRIPDETIDELVSAGLTGIVTPRVFGGSELGFSSLVEITAELAAACGSTGWVFGVLTGHSWMLNLFPMKAQREVLEDPRALSSTVFRLGGTVTKVDGGYKLVGGEGRFCSGIDFAKWVIVGNAVQRADGPPQPRFFLVPASEVEVVDDWFTAGMRGTGSRSIKIKEAFIPEHRSVSMEDLQAGTTEGGQFHAGAIYKMPFMDLPPFSIIGAPMGMARGALHSFAAGIKGKLGSFNELQLAEQSAMFARVAQSSVDADAAYALVMEMARAIDEATTPDDVNPMLRARIPRDMSYAAQQCRYSVTRLFEINGGGGIYEGSDLQRIWRDVNAASSHFAFSWDSAATNYGRAALGLTLNKFGPKGR